jgi:hypothetical protein
MENSQAERPMISVTKKQSSRPQRLIDPNDPLHASIEDALVGLSPKERVRRLHEMFPPKKR